MGAMFLRADMRAADGFEAWRHAVRESRACEVSTDREDVFRGSMRRLRLGPVTLLRSSFSGLRITSTAATARRADPEVYHVTLLLKGSFALTRGAEPTQVFTPGHLHVVDDSSPFDLRAFASGTVPPSDQRVDAIGLDFPVSLLPWSPDQLRAVQGRGFTGGEGVAGVLAEHLLSLDRRGPELGAVAAPHVGTAVVDLVAGWLAQELAAEGALSQEARLGALAASIRGFIQRNLHDPQLSPSMVAAAHHISLSYLHRVFGQQSQGETVAAWIRGQRLEKARRDLSDPTLRALPVHAVAARWGIPRASDFSRSFRAAYGLSPLEYRMRELLNAGGGG
ncbi:AraC family transcriptional regulator [Streptomyces sp. SID10815]|nr:AraC family transcriptional regulator [Streptomyces sp. SID10815]